MKSQIVTSNAIPPERVERRILLVRGHKVMLDDDLAELYEIETKVLNQAVRRNIRRFPRDFMFQLTPEESRALRSQIVTSNEGRGGRRYRPYAFTQEGVAMLSSVLRSPRAVQVNIAIMRAFVMLREILATNRDLASRLDELESKYHEQFRVVFDAIRELMRPPEKPRRRIGFAAATDYPPLITPPCAGHLGRAPRNPAPRTKARLAAGLCALIELCEASTRG
ncbi:MAG: ORF6N domain-containing protein [Acidobacteriota bacterium]